MSQEKTYTVAGMHCAACEVLIEKKLLEIPGVKTANASTANGRAVVEYEGDRPSVDALNELFKRDNYTFSEQVGVAQINNVSHPGWIGAFFAGVVAVVFLLLDRLGISGLLNIGATSSVITFFGFGLLASLSSCAALVGGMVLSLSKQWNGLYASSDTLVQKSQPHFLFTLGRIISYVFLGGILGLIGSRLALSFTATAWLVIAISVIMIGLGLQMIGIAAFKGFQVRLPKSMTRNFVNEKNFQGKYMPLVMGALTFFLPCGFTITAQTVALLSGSALQGALIMGFFALGTTPILLLIGLSSVKFFSKPHLAIVFSRAAGYLVLFFALYNIWSQMTVLGLIV